MLENVNLALFANTILMLVRIVSAHLITSPSSDIEVYILIGLHSHA